MITLTAEHILLIPKDHPEKLFTYDNYVKESRLLLKIWHPDHSIHPQSHAVTTHILALIKSAKHKISNNTWTNNAILEFRANDTTYRLHYKKHHKFELGDMYISDTKVIYVVDIKYKKLFYNAVNNLGHIKYADDYMKLQFHPCIPKSSTVYTTDNNLILLINKTRDMLLLQDVIDHFNGKLDVKHTAWVVSRLYNISAFLEYNKLVHNAISPMTVFISPVCHTVCVYGGWWYSRKNDEKLLGIPGNLINMFPKSVLSNKIVDSKVDRLLIKGTAIAALGDETMVGSKLLTSKHIPTGLINWLRQPSITKASTEYKDWSSILIKYLGPRTFTKLDLSVDNIY